MIRDTRATRSAAELLLAAPNRRPSFIERPPSAGEQRRLARTQSQTGLELTKLKKVEFNPGAGKHGMVFQNTIVTSATGQAEKVGVERGWKIHSIDGCPVSNDKEIWMLLQDGMWQWRATYVSFVTDRPSIRAWASQAKDASLKDELERLARLPFKDAHDSRHITPLKEEFCFQGYIANPEDRAITLKQLERTLSWSAANCHRWRDNTSTSGSRLHIDYMNLYHLNHWLIRPATKEKTCSFVEMLTCSKQPPGWFLVCWSGQRLLDVVECVKVHMSTRRLAENEGYWLSAFANRQHSVHEVEAVHPDKSSTGVFRAITAAQSRILITLDPKTEINGPATAFKRLWCQYECLMCLPESDPVLDVAHVSGSKVMLITKGLTDEEENMELRNHGTGWKAKAEREKMFSLDVIEASLQIRVDNAQTLEGADRSRILNRLAGRPLDAQVLEKSDAYAKASIQLRALFALTFFRRVIAGISASDTDMQRLQTSLTEAIRGDAWRESVELSLAWCGAIEEKVPLLLRSLPPSLKWLGLDLQGSGIASEAMPGLASGLPVGLEGIRLDLSHNELLVNDGMKAYMEKLPVGLMQQNLILSDTSVSKEFQNKSHSLEAFQQHLLEDAQRGASCVTTNLLPAPTGRMVQSVARSRIV
eukprot:TRINITY_DN62566_c0_g1_i1.p1 TRINITY_DN62566_c0_g1~~TRINITY_DN62566_c0_g1_i1.p1  ORF type:complete len:646 (-),score=97.12 TRINITY_DN62566_c0_g1_i1:301-2238(-)